MQFQSNYKLFLLFKIINCEIWDNSTHKTLGYCMETMAGSHLISVLFPERKTVCKTLSVKVQLLILTSKCNFWKINSTQSHQCYGEVVYLKVHMYTYIYIYIHKFKSAYFFAYGCVRLSCAQVWAARLWAPAVVKRFPFSCFTAS